jgi:hypothetical protein
MKPKDHPDEIPTVEIFEGVLEVAARKELDRPLRTFRGGGLTRRAHPIGERRARNTDRTNGQLLQSDLSDAE